MRDLHEAACSPPAAHLLVEHWPGRQVMGHHEPLCRGFHDVAHTVVDLAHVDLAHVDLAQVMTALADITWVGVASA